MKTISRRAFLNTSIAVGASTLPFSNLSAAASFGPESSAEDVTEGLDLRGKTAVVTGCNSGLGLETMRVLALRGAHVIGTARTLEKGREACASVAGNTTPVVLELSDFASVADCGKTILTLTESVDILVCNAGVIYGELRQINGLEAHFVINHLGHFLLTNWLANAVTAAPQGRVVVVGSNNHKQAPAGGIQFNSLSGEGWGNYYHHSKLANGLFSLHLAEQFRKSRAISNCVTPGPVRGTGILRNIPESSDNYRKSVPQGAATQCYVASHPALASISGEYFADCQPAAQSEHQKDKNMAAKLWRVSLDLTKDYLP